MNPLSRREFLRRGATAGLALASVGGLEPLLASIASGASETARGYGPLVADPAGLIDLPARFQYRAFSTARHGAIDDPRFGAKLSNGDPVPPLHDGMGAFSFRRGITVLVRNHEIDLADSEAVDPARARPYDPLGAGGTTTLWVDSDRNLVKSFASLSGTVCNCAGGVTPWESWLSAEECVYLPGAADPVNHDLTPLVKRRHGYVFEVDARAEALVDPVPIVGMGRFYHEAVAVDPATGFVYLTEDRLDGLLYRYRPDALLVGARAPIDMRLGDLALGGVLEALRVVERPAARLQNWGGGAESDTSGTSGADTLAAASVAPVAPGERLAIDWVRISNPDPDMDEERDPADSSRDPLQRRPRTASSSTRAQGLALGAAQFARAEGMIQARDAIYFCCTNGGPAKAGQVWRLDPRRAELSLVVQPDDRALMQGPDNLCAAPTGDLIVCEDGPATDRVLGVTPQGRIYVLARNAVSSGEFAGACFSRDGRTLFVNIQNPGITFAIWGPWNERHG